MNKTLPIIALLLGVIIVTGCIGPATPEEQNQTQNQTGTVEELNQTLEQTGEALNSAASELGDLDLSDLTVKEGF